MSTDIIIIQLFGNDVDVSQWLHKHPGGKKLLKIFQNRDATQQFVAIHKGPAAMKTLQSLPKKPSAFPPNYDEAEKEFNAILETLYPRLSKVTIWYEVVKVVYVISFWVIGYALCFFGRKSIGLPMICLSMYQAGWVGHDYSHRSVFDSPSLNNKMSDFLGWVQGYSDIWWKSRHNTHHMTTNELGNDPDIKTEPVLHFYDDNQKLSNFNSPKHFKHIPLQNLFFVAVLSLLDIFWRYETIAVLLKDCMKYKNDILKIIVHYMLLGNLIISTNVTCIDLFLLMLVRGFMTACIVFANHYPEERIAINSSSPSMGLFQQTLRTSRNTTGLFFHHANNTIMRKIFNEATGFLSMQNEHHLMPTIPPNNLMILRPYVQALALKYNIPYKETSVVHALYDNIVKLTASTPLDFKLLGRELRHIQ
jgi:fatty acid desaturase